LCLGWASAGAGAAAVRRDVNGAVVRPQRLGLVGVPALPSAVVEVVGTGVLHGGLVLVGCAGCMIEVVLKLLDRLGDHVKLLIVECEGSRFVGVADVVIFVFPLVDGGLLHVKVREGVGNLECVADLAAVPSLLLGKLVVEEVPSCIAEDRCFVDKQPWPGRDAWVHAGGSAPAFGIDLPQFPEVHFKDCHGLVQAQIGVVEAQVDSGLERLVQCSHTVRGEKEDAVVILEDAQKD
jgi:hypothetical protein